MASPHINVNGIEYVVLKSGDETWLAYCPVENDARPFQVDEDKSDLAPHGQFETVEQVKFAAVRAALAEADVLCQQGKLSYSRIVRKRWISKRAGVLEHEVVQYVGEKL